MHHRSARGRGTPQRGNPRRKPAHESVSLRRLQASLPTSSANALATGRFPSAASIAHQQQSNLPGRAPSTSSLINNRDSSGESSNLDTWFESSNNNPAAQPRNPSDNEPPFYLRNNSSDDSPPDNTTNAFSLPIRMLPGDLNSTRSEDYRAVIDDLTLQIRWLRRQVKRYQRQYDKHLQSHKLFEVVMHPAMPSNRKRAFRELLRHFATTLDVPCFESSSTGLSSSSFGPSPPGASSGLAPSSSLVAGPSHRPSQSVTSHVNDSGYGSLSVSNQNSTNQPSGQTPAQSTGALPKHDANEHIYSYLRGVPKNIAPRPPKVMTERGRKRLVVQRLEQIFGGRGPIDGHQQTQQQQEVSQSAARESRTNHFANTGRNAPPEGVREARIMPPQDDSAPTKEEKPIDNVEAPDLEPTPPTSNNSPFPEQRPTRPRDLDPYRAQIPSDNAHYIRHLGFSLPANSKNSPVDDEGWIYLNLLINMAQLHTINVTPDFVKRALAEVNNHFEISPDGRKLRWRGGDRMSSSHDSGGDSESPLYAVHEKPHLGMKRLASLSGHANKKPHVQSTKDHDYLYTPLFPRRSESDEDILMADNDSMGSFYPEDVTGESSGLYSSGQRGLYGHRQDDGPIIFYSKLPFCTDLSGDWTKPYQSPLLDLAQQGLARETGPRHKAIGIPPPSSKPTKLVASTSMSGSPLAKDPSDSSAHERYFEVDTESLHGPPESLGESTAGDGPIFHVETDSFMTSPRHVTFADTRDLSSFEACGLGGSQPADHFLTTVSRQISTKPKPLRAGAPSFLRPRPATHLDGILSRSRPSRLYESKVLSERTRVLTPSVLPRASYYYLDEHHDESDPDYEDDDEDDDQDLELKSLPLLNPGPLFFPDEDRDSAGGSGEDTDSVMADDDDQSVDFLAHARQVDPQLIRAKERQYDAEMAERWAEEIPAGSSAATAGGGSGFNSPALPKPEGSAAAAQQQRRQSDAEADRPNVSDTSDDDEEDDEDGSVSS